MKSIIWIVLLFSGISFFATGQEMSTSSSENSVNQALRFFENQRAQRHEKVWLHLDKSYYVAGDTIWFKAYLTNAVTHVPDTLSNFVYVDLMNRQNKVVLAKKIKRDSLGIFSNNVELPVVFPAGEYILRAYTGWMLNFDPGFFCQRNLSIGNAVIDKTNTSITYSADQAIIRFFNLNGTPRTGISASFKLFNKDDRIIASDKRETTPTGALFVPLPPDSLLKGCYIKAALSKEEKENPWTFYLQPQHRNYGVQFFPEGGNLIANTPRLVAFKAEASDGYPADVSGVVVNTKGDTITSFRSEHDGMGTLLLIPQPGETYRALCSCEDQSITVKLPEVREAGCAISTTRSESYIQYQVDGRIPEGSVLVGHVRGMCCMIQPIDTASCKGAIPLQSLHAGILHLLLIDSAGKPYSERLVFVPEANPAQWRVATDKPRYDKRQRITVDIAMVQDGEPIEGDFSVSVTDSKMVKYDSLEDNIHSNLLLCSDLKGHIHNPGYYFLNNSRKTHRHLDLVMLTHGWRRFRTDNLTRTDPFIPNYYFEHGQYISGHIIGMMGRSAPEAKVNAIALTDKSTIGSTTTDLDGNFVIDSLDFRDTTLFIFAVKTRRGRSVQAVEVDSSYPKPAFTPIHPYRRSDEKVQLEMEAYMQAIRSKSGMINGMKSYTLGEVVVTTPNPRRPRMTSVDSDVYDASYFGKFSSVPLHVYLRAMPFVSYLRGLFWLRKVDRIGTASFEGSNIPAGILVNGQGRDADYLIGYKVEDVEYIQVSRGRGGYRIEIILKKGHERGSPEYPVHRMIGYTESVEFYHPVYDTPEQVADENPDKRMTLYWNPDLRVGPDGKAQIEFYSDDTEDPQYEITIEGITLQGIPCRYQQKITGAIR